MGAQLMEISTVFLDIGQFLRAMGKQNTKVGKAMMLAFVVSYFFCRVINYPVIIWNYSVVKSAEWNRMSFLLRRVLLLGFYLIQLYWFWKIFDFSAKSSVNRQATPTGTVFTPLFYGIGLEIKTKTSHRK